MKKFMTLFMVLVFTFTLGVGILMAAFQLDQQDGYSQSIEADGHLVWDKVDQIYYCLGTPSNCKFSSQAQAD